MKLGLLAITEQGWQTAATIAGALEGAELFRGKESTPEALADAWHRFDGIVCVMAAGIVVRCLAGLMAGKHNDPCVVVVDEAGRYAVSLLSGHLGGGNQLARQVATICGGEAVITTGSDVAGHTALDLWALDSHLHVYDKTKLAATSRRLLDAGRLTVYQESNYLPSLPADLVSTSSADNADIIVTVAPQKRSEILQLIPRIRHIGLGCRRGVTVAEFEDAISRLRELKDLCLESIAGLASVDLKRDERGLLEYGRRNNWPIRFFSAKRLNNVTGYKKSEIVQAKIGTYGVCEPAALLAASRGERTGRLIIEKVTWKRITAAVAESVY